RRLADARRGQVPVPEGAPDPAPPEAAPGPRCARSVAFRLPRGASGVRVRVDGRARRAVVRRRAGRPVVLVARPAARAARVRITARVGPRTWRRSAVVRACA
ncbi:MAG TPA: hypothetical protein VD931_05470, partial [Baekduia sp.]|nr:hypothetical protein [Baekduia sp.]